jgi:hypothetical protein
VSEFADYIRHGWALCAITPSSKAPDYHGWNTPEKAIPLEAADGLDGAGLMHALSGTCALDIDDITLARPWLAERGVSIDDLLVSPDAVRIESGRAGRSKLLYRLPKPMRTLKPTNSGLELRSGTANGKSVQDALPPTVHPVTHKPYFWVYGEPLTGDWRELPAIPPALYAAWRELIADTPITAVSAAPSATIEELRRLIKNESPDCGYDPWIEIGFQIHHESQGSEEGLALWNEWSAKAPKLYPGPDMLRAHWVSFSSAPGKRVKTAGSLKQKDVATADEFDIIPPEVVEAPDEHSTAQTMRAQVAERKAAALAKLEARLVYVIDSERYFDCERHRIYNSDSAIEHMFTSWMPRKKNGDRENPVKVLKESPTKRFVDRIGFHPGEGAVYKYNGDSFANRYRNRLPEPLEPTAGELERIEWLFGRIDDADYRTWLLQFYGHVVQHPGIKIKSAPLIWSDEQGNGKTTLVRMVPSLLVDPQYSCEVNYGLLHSDFNDYLLNAWHVNLAEFRAATRGEREAISKKVESLIADDTIAINPKGSAGWTMPNHVFVTASSNADDAAAISNTDRKWAIHEMHAAQMTVAEQSYIYQEFLLTPRAAGVLRHYFLAVDLTGFAASARAPQTAARQEMVAASISSDVECLQTAFDERADIFDRDIVTASHAVAYVHKHSLMKPNAHRVGRLLAKPPFNGKAIQFRVGERRFQAVIIRNHKAWDGAFGKDIMAHIDGEDIDITA